MEKTDKRLRRPGYEKAKWMFDMCMKLLDVKIKPEKEKKRLNLMEIYPNSWLDLNMFGINCKNFNIKTLKRFLCHRVLRLSDNKRIPISSYERFFDLEKKPKDYVDLTVISEYADEPERMMLRLRELAYDTCLKFVNTRDMCYEENEEKATNEKVAAYIEFAHAILLYDIFVQAGLVTTKASFELMQDEINECNENGDCPVRMVVEDERMLAEVPLGAVPFISNVEELVRKETRHLIALYALRTMIQVTEYLCAFARIKGSSLETRAIPDFARPNFNLLEYILSGGENLLQDFLVSAAGEITPKYRKFFTYYREKTLVHELFSGYDERKQFEQECRGYIRWMENWLNKDEDWKIKEDAVITDENHPEINMASIIFTDEDGDLLPAGKTLWTMFYDAVKEVCT